MTGYRVVARAMLAKDTCCPCVVLRGGCVLRFATGSALSGKHFGFWNTDGGYATETPTV